jgi:hypothetical protein
VLGGVVGALAASGVAVLLALQLAKPDIPEAVRTAGPAEGPTAPAAVAGLVADQGRWTADSDSWQVSLTWEPVDGAAGYLVFRNGRKQGEIDATEFVDRTVAPQERYLYQVIVVDAERHRSKPSRTRVRTDPLPNADARVEGRWILRLEIRSSSIGIGGGRILATFDPSCREGPCAVRWRFEDLGNTGTAEPRGTRYQGSGAGGFLTRDCHGGTVGSTQLTLTFEIDTAHAVDRVWRATEISGTLTESVPSVSNCLSARNEWSFEGSAQG